MQKGLLKRNYKESKITSRRSVNNNENADMASIVISEIHHDYRNIMNF